MDDKEFQEWWQDLGAAGRARAMAFLRLRESGVLEHNRETGEFVIDLAQVDETNSVVVELLFRRREE